MLYYAPPSGDKVVAVMQTGRLRMLVSPGNRANVHFPGVRFVADNGCFSTAYPGDEKWWRWLNKWDLTMCDWAVAPDVVGDAKATLERSAPHLPRIRDLGIPAALVGQDGLERLPIPWDDFDVLFLGGSTRWKLGPGARAITREACHRGKWVHMGRVNSLVRLQQADAWGCTSADGTRVKYEPDRNLAQLMGWLAQVNGEHRE